MLQLHPECAPHSVYYILSLLTMRHCAGCQFHRAENRGSYWDSQGNHINNVRNLSQICLLNISKELRICSHTTNIDSCVMMSSIWFIFRFKLVHTFLLHTFYSLYEQRFCFVCIILSSCSCRLPMVHHTP